MKLLLAQLKQIMIALDQLLNTLIGLIRLPISKSIAWADETISAHAYRKSRTSKGWNRIRAFIDAVFFLQETHCLDSYDNEQKRLSLPPEYRNQK